MCHLFCFIFSVQRVVINRAPEQATTWWHLEGWRVRTNEHSSYRLKCLTKQTASFLSRIILNIFCFVSAKLVSMSLGFDWKRAFLRFGEQACTALLDNFFNDGLTWHDTKCNDRRHIVCEVSLNISVFIDALLEKVPINKKTGFFGLNSRPCLSLTHSLTIVEKHYQRSILETFDLWDIWSQ